MASFNEFSELLPKAHNGTKCTTMHDAGKQSNDAFSDLPTSNFGM
jgi:hypothetical protein